MYKGQVDYIALMQGINFEPFEINRPHPSISKVHIEATDDNVKISFYVSDVQSASEASNLTQSMLEDLLDRLSFSLGVPVGPAKLCGASVKREIPVSNGSMSKIVDVQCTDIGTFSDNVTIVKNLDPQSTQTIQNALEQKQMPGIQYFNRFRVALQNTDPVARFMDLYRILLSIFDDNQKQVDQFIQAAEPNVPISPRPDKPHIKETIYTRLRNEIGHLRPNVVPSHTREEIKHWVSPMVGLVKKAIDQTP